MEGIDWNAAKVLLDAGQWLITILVAIYVWWQSRNRATREAIEDLREDIRENETRIGRLENNMEHMPTHGDMSAVKKELSFLRADVREMSGTMRGLNRAVDLMTEHLMNKGKARE